MRAAVVSHREQAGVYSSASVEVCGEARRNFAAGRNRSSPDEDDFIKAISPTFLVSARQIMATQPKVFKMRWVAATAESRFGRSRLGRWLGKPDCEAERATELLRNN